MGDLRISARPARSCPNVKTSPKTAGHDPVDLSGILLRRSFVGGSLAGQSSTWRHHPAARTVTQPALTTRQTHVAWRISRRWGETTRRPRPPILQPGETRYSRSGGHASAPSYAAAAQLRGQAPGTASHRRHVLRAGGLHDRRLGYRPGRPFASGTITAGIGLTVGSLRVIPLLS